MSKIDTMVNTAITIAKDDSHGYSQYRRWPSQGTDFDCSSLMYYCAHKAGYNVPLSGYTGTMLADFKNAGFNALKFSSVGLNGLKRGDILLAHNGNRQHTELYIGDGKTVGAHIAETGDIDGKPGDQTSNEISIANISGSWDYVLRPPAESGGTTVKPAFRVSTDSSGKKWQAENALPTSSKIRWLAVRGAKKYRVKTADGWLPYVTGYNVKDLDYGCAGDGSVITAIDIRM